MIEMGVGSSIVTCSILVGDGDNGRGHACLGKNIWEILVPFPQFCCKRKLLLKKERKEECCWDFRGGLGLRIYAPNAGTVSQGTKIPHSMQHSQKIF